MITASTLWRTAFIRLPPRICPSAEGQPFDDADDTVRAVRIFRYLYLVFQKDVGSSPEEVLLKDRPLLVCVLLWGLTAAMLLYIFSPLGGFFPA